MFGWRKRNDGFEWRKYVRTTILVRRQDRRQRIAGARDAALASLQEAGRKGANAGATAAQSAKGWLARLAAVAAPAARRGLAAAGTGLIIAGARLQSGGRGLGKNLSRGALASGQTVRRGCEELDRPALAAIFALTACAASLGLLARVVALARSTGLPQWPVETGTLALLAAALVSLLLFAAPALAIGAGRRVPALKSRLSDVASLAGLAAQALGQRVARVPGLRRFGEPRLGLVAVIGIGLMMAAGTIGLASRRLPLSSETSAGRKAMSAPAGSLNGRAIAVSGDTLRIETTAVKLEGVEAPDPDQVCERPGSGTWSCGVKASQALARLVKGRRVHCEITGQEGANAAGRCTVNGEDLGAALVRTGAVFAASGLFAAYGKDERAAREARLGLWNATPERPPERPEAWRAKRWEEAKRSAPDGCPIKGHVSAKGRVYLLPWSHGYERVKVNASRGGRWFCSEDEAKSAGWRSEERL